MKRTGVNPMETRGMLARLDRAVVRTVHRTGRGRGRPPRRIEEALEPGRPARLWIPGVVKAARVGLAAFGAWAWRRCPQRG